MTLVARFVQGFGRDATREGKLFEVFRPYGSVEECHIVVDKVTGQAKGYDFVLFRTCAGAVKALKQPQQRINGRVVFCQLSAAGADSARRRQGEEDTREQRSCGSEP